MINFIFKMLCIAGIHIPRNKEYCFTDWVDGKEVYLGRCSCGIKWVYNSTRKVKASNQQ